MMCLWGEGLLCIEPFTSILVYLETLTTSLLSCVMKFKYKVINNLITWEVQMSPCDLSNFLAIHDNILSKRWWKWSIVLRDCVVRMKNSDKTVRITHSVWRFGTGLGNQGICVGVPVGAGDSLLFQSIQTGSGPISLGVERLGCEADHSPLSVAEVKNAWRYTSTPSCVFTAWCLIKHRENCTFHLTQLGLNTTLNVKKYYIVTDLFNALPGNSSVNTFQRATMEAMSQ
jgi:hypothetical protein